MIRSRLAATTIAAALALTACSSGGGDSQDAGASTVAVTGTDGLQFEPSSLTASAGTLTVELTAEPGVEHTFVIEELDDTEVVAAAPGETATGTIDLNADSYTFYCSVEGHRSAGMEGELTVSG